MRSGAPESSNCPPGSSVMLAPFSCASAIGWPASSTGDQPGSLSAILRKSAPMPRGPSWGTGRQVPVYRPIFSCSVPTRHRSGGFSPLRMKSTS